MGTHPIFESDFDCLTDCKVGLNKWQSCLWKRRSETKSMKIFSKRASWLPKRSAKEMRDDFTRMSKRWKLAGHQSLSVADIPRLSEAAVCVASLLLGVDQRGRRVLEGIPPPSARDRARHHEETGENRRQPAARRRTCRSAHSGILARPKGRVPTSRKGRQCRTGRGRLHLPRRRTWRCSPVICIPVCSINTLA